MRRVMIVDDAVIVRMIMRLILSEHRFEVVAEARNGLEAIQLYEAHKPDIVTMDVAMPKLNGIDALKGILEIDPDAKVIMCTANSDQQTVAAAREIGAAGMIVKPFDLERMIGVLDHALLK